MLNFFRVYGDVDSDITNDVNVSFAVYVDRIQHIQIFGDPFFFHSGRLYRGIVESNSMVITFNADGDMVVIADKSATLKPGAFRQLFRLGDQRLMLTLNGVVFIQALSAKRTINDIL